MKLKKEADKSNKNYVDRAQLRRDTVGLDYSHIESEKMTNESASVKVSINENNIGFKLLKNMGWVEGKGLGKQENGIVEPVIFIASFMINKRNKIIIKILFE
jgi:hypothetical protein